ncbi:hypothetical protein [Mycoplasma sp. CSL7503-lung]|uniref:hypothetical protein n=1 Tax=Mycoplasma sp. CSL7503-lung TaxID=536372 RepID=UPI0021CFBB7B|nr:hypothetical protein [Mycoplasma sp. CSL7503-lung]MCU4706318.1 hypothetical protein [Mycoplasma sp. CSL7503-lung]
MKKNKINGVDINFAILRNRFINDIDIEIKKVEKLKKKKKSDNKYLKMLSNLRFQLYNNIIKSEDLRINYLAFLKIKKEYNIKKITKYIVLAGIVFMIVVISIILSTFL